MDTLHLTVSENIKRLRREQGMSMEELAKESGVSKSMLAQLERGDGNPTLSTLWKLANGMKVPFSALVAQPKAPYEIVRMRDLTPVLENGGKVKNYALFPDSGERRFSVYCLRAEPNSAWASEPHLRDTEEFITVFSGVLEVRVGERSFTLTAGDSLRFAADVPHAYRSTGTEAAVFHNILYNA